MSDLKRFIEKRKQVIIKDLKNNSNLNTKEHERIAKCGRDHLNSSYRWYIVGHHNN